MCGKMCGKIEKLLDCNKNWCGSRYGPRDYDSGDKKTKKNCGKICGKMYSKMCGKIEKLSDWNKNWYGSRYGPCDYDSGDKKTKNTIKTKKVIKKIQKKNSE